MPIGDPGIIAIRIVRGDTVFHVHGEQAGAEGVWLAAGQVEGIYDAPVKTTWKTGAFQEGSWQKYNKWLHRDLSLGFHIRDTFTEYELNESLFRQIFDYQLDPWEETPTVTTIEVETNLSGVRKLDVLMYEAPVFTSDLDPLVQQYGNLIFKLRAGQPSWYQDNVVTSFSDTVAASSGGVTVENKTDHTSYHKWILTRATWTLPDYQWVGGREQREPGGAYGTRMISNIIVSDTNGGATVDLDRQNLMFRDANDTNILGQLAGQFFLFPIPPYTPPTILPVTYSAAPAGGAMAQLVVPQRWTRPWGMEMPYSPTSAPHKPKTVIYAALGSHVYGIPQWADTIDVVAVGGGGAGEGGLIVGFGHGGYAGGWSAQTLVRGTDIPWATTTISGYVGSGGSPQGPGQPGWQGQNSSTDTGINAPGGAGGSGGIPLGSGDSNRFGADAGLYSFNGRDYRGR
jgi:hypothetical protein